MRDWFNWKYKLIIDDYVINYKKGSYWTTSHTWENWSKVTFKCLQVFMPGQILPQVPSNLCFTLVFLCIWEAKKSLVMVVNVLWDKTPFQMSLSKKLPISSDQHLEIHLINSPPVCKTHSAINHNAWLLIPRSKNEVTAKFKSFRG